MPDTYTSIFLHVVFSTKGRRPLIAPELRPHLEAYIAGIVSERGGRLIVAGGVEDHMHLLVRWNTEPLKDLLRHIKAGSSRHINSERREFAPFYWQRGGGVFSVSKSETDRVAAYIRNQEEHHRTMSFREEYLRFLDLHGIDYDQRYIWD